jgi:hypothetical protein
MARRYYISPIIGTGAWGDPYRAALADSLTESGAAISVLIPTDAAGTPKFNFALCIVGAANHAVLQAVAAIDSMPDITLDSQLSVLTTAQKNALLNFATKRGISTAGLTNASTFRQVLERIGKFLDIDFNALNFSCSDI